MKLNKEIIDYCYMYRGIPNYPGLMSYSLDDLDLYLKNNYEIGIDFIDGIIKFYFMVGNSNAFHFLDFDMPYIETFNSPRFKKEYFIEARKELEKLSLL